MIEEKWINVGKLTDFQNGKRQLILYSNTCDMIWHIGIIVNGKQYNEKLTGGLPPTQSWRTINRSLEWQVLRHTQNQRNNIVVQDAEQDGALYKRYTKVVDIMQRI